MSSVDCICVLDIFTVDECGKSNGKSLVGLWIIQLLMPLSLRSMHDHDKGILLIGYKNIPTHPSMGDLAQHGRHGCCMCQAAVVNGDQ